MAETATHPVSPIHAQVAANGREVRQGERLRSDGGRSAPIEERTAVLEARWDETVPTLATRADLREVENRLIKWVLGAVIALVAVFVAVFTATTARIDALNSKIDQHATRQDTRMDAFDNKIDQLAARQDARMDALDSKIDQLAARQDARMDALDAKLDRLDAKLDTRFDALMAELRARRQ